MIRSRNPAQSLYSAMAICTLFSLHLVTIAWSASAPNTQYKFLRYPRFVVHNNALPVLVQDLSSTLRMNISFEDPGPIAGFPKDTCIVRPASCLPIGTTFDSMPPVEILNRILDKYSHLIYVYDLGKKSINIFPNSHLALLSDTATLSADNRTPFDILIAKDDLGLKSRKIHVDPNRLPSGFRKTRISVREKSKKIRGILNSIVESSALPIRWELLGASKPGKDYLWELRFVEFDSMLARKKYLEMEIDTLSLGDKGVDYIARDIHETCGLKFGIENIGPCPEFKKEMGVAKHRTKSQGNGKNASTGRSSIRVFMTRYVSENPCYTWRWDSARTVLNILPKKNSSLKWEIGEFKTHNSLRTVLEEDVALSLRKHSISFYNPRATARGLDQPRDITLEKGPVINAFNKMVNDVDSVYMWRLDSEGNDSQVMSFR